MGGYLRSDFDVVSVCMLISRTTHPCMANKWLIYESTFVTSLARSVCRANSLSVFMMLMQAELV